MKKFQQIIADNIETIAEAHTELMETTDCLTDRHILRVYTIGGVLQMINSDYDYSHLPLNVATDMAEILRDWRNIKHEGRGSNASTFIENCTELANSITVDVDHHRRQKPMFNG